MWTQRIHELAVAHGRDLDDLFEWWSERAAIREHVGGSADADVAAFEELQQMLAAS